MADLGNTWNEDLIAEPEKWDVLRRHPDYPQTKTSYDMYSYYLRDGEAFGPTSRILIDSEFYDDQLICLHGSEVDDMPDEMIVQLVRKSRKRAQQREAQLRLASLFSEEGWRWWALCTLDDLQRGYDRYLETLALIAAECRQTRGRLRTLADYYHWKNQNAGYVYCLSDQLGHYKIGLTRSLDQRIKQLSTQPPFELQLVAYHKAIDCHAFEKAAHEYYAPKRLRGEWFSLDDKEVEAFQKNGWRYDYYHRKYESGAQ